jgi:CheY-like chemotaxis protein
VKALLVDDDVTSRTLLRMALTRTFNWATVEAGDGLEALRLIDNSHIGVVFLDVHMPLMDGVETLQVLRESPRHAGLPVIMLTSENEDQVVRQVITLGVADYLIKPLSADMIAQRVTRAMSRITAAPRKGADDADVGRQFQPHGVTMVVDSEADFRHFVKSVMEKTSVVLEADSGIAALRQCAESAPQTIFIGSSTGVLNPIALVRKLRTMPELAHTWIVSVTTPAERATYEHAPGVDAWVGRTFVPEAFLSQLRHLASPQADDVADEYRSKLVSAAEQVFGMMLSLQVETLAEPPAEEDEGIVTHVDLTVDGADAAWRFELACSMPSARRIAAALGSMEIDQVTMDDALATTRELANMITSRVQNAMRERGSNVVCSLPRSAAAPWTPAAASGGSSVFLAAATSTLRVSLERAAVEMAA